MTHDLVNLRDLLHLIYAIIKFLIFSSQHKNQLFTL